MFHFDSNLKKKDQITILNTIHLKKRCSGSWFGNFFGGIFGPKWKILWDKATFSVFKLKSNLPVCWGRPRGHGVKTYWRHIWTAHSDQISWIRNLISQYVLLNMYIELQFENVSQNSNLKWNLFLVHSELQLCGIQFYLLRRSVFKNMRRYELIVNNQLFLLPPKYFTVLSRSEFHVCI